MTTGRTAILGTVLAAILAAVPVALAQSAPAQPPAAQSAPRPPAPAAGQQGGSIFKPGATTALDGDRRALIERISTYLSSVRTLSGDFVQIAPNGQRSTGQFFIQKPGKVRFEYDPPSPIDIVADGQSVAVRDRKLATQDIYPLSQTPLRFLLSTNIDLLRDTNLVGVYADDTYATVVIEENQPLVGTNRLMLMFGAKDLQLKQWVVTDPQGFDTTVAVSNLDSKKRPDPSLFKIDYQRMLQ